MKYSLTYDDIIQTVSEMVDNKKIIKEGLTLTYTIPALNHKKLDEELYYRHNPNGGDFIHHEIIEIEIGNINVTILEAK
tara:strand:+ start:6236 stop:6472 length:237 start_codon:yes stop_codon:yes gene_type:complete